MSFPQASAAFLFHLIGSLQVFPETIHQPQITLTGLEIWCILWCSGLCYLIKMRLLETIKKQDWCQVGTITLCLLPLIILSGPSMKCEFVWSRVGVTVLDIFPFTSPCLVACSFSYHHLPASPTQVLSLIVDFSGAITELLFGRKAWRCYPGKLINIDQHPLHGRCLKLSVCISISSVPLPLLNFLGASLSRSQWGRHFFKNCNSLLISSD